MLPHDDDYTAKTNGAKQTSPQTSESGNKIKIIQRNCEGKARDNDDLARILGNESKKTKGDWLKRNTMDGPETNSNHNRACHTKNRDTKLRKEKKIRREKSICILSCKTSITIFSHMPSVVFWIRNHFQVAFCVVYRRLIGQQIRF